MLATILLELCEFILLLQDFFSLSITIRASKRTDEIVFSRQNCYFAYVQGKVNRNIALF